MARRKPTASMRLAVYAKSDFACAGCGWRPPRPVEYSGRYCLYGYVERPNGTQALWTLDLDHIFPHLYGGAFELGNLQALCSSCNAKKGAKILA